jgi:hypothetical protein
MKFEIIFFISSIISLFDIVHCSYNKFTKYPNCKHCKHYKRSMVGNEFSKCTKFFNEIKNYNIIIYEYADLMRLDEDKCGKEGKFYENKEYRDMLDIITDQHL